jgi:hypothetical protein
MMTPESPALEIYGQKIIHVTYAINLQDFHRLRVVVRIAILLAVIVVCFSGLD